MSVKVLPGGITRGVRIIEKPDTVSIRIESRLCGRRYIPCPFLDVIEGGDTRSLPITVRVAEVLIANGMSYGN